MHRKADARSALTAALERIDRPWRNSLARTSCGGECPELGLPGLSLGSGWPIAVPMTADAAGFLISGCPSLSPSGFGRRGNAETVADASVRLAYEASADGVRVSNPQWDVRIQTLVRERVVKGLGLGFGRSGDPAGGLCDYDADCEIEARLYKVLVYPVGGHFAPHVDTEKEPGMIATLVVQLPSVCEGGVLAVRGSEPAEYDFGAAAGTAAHACHFAAFYCDAPHEVLPVISGARVAMAYNIVRRAPPAASSGSRSSMVPMDDVTTKDPEAIAAIDQPNPGAETETEGDKSNGGGDEKGEPDGKLRGDDSAAAGNTFVPASLVQPDSLVAEVANACSPFLAAWRNSMGVLGRSDRLVMALEHAYSRQSVTDRGLAALKGRDFQCGALLFSAADQANRTNATPGRSQPLHRRGFSLYCVCVDVLNVVSVEPWDDDFDIAVLHARTWMELAPTRGAADPSRERDEIKTNRDGYVLDSFQEYFKDKTSGDRWLRDPQNVIGTPWNRPAMENHRELYYGNEAACALAQLEVCFLVLELL